MSSEKRATVRHPRLARKAAAAGLARLDAICFAGAQCEEVQASPMGVVALDDLQTRVTALHAASSAVQAALTERRAATKALWRDFGRADNALRVYERTVAGLAGGDAAVITRAGLLARDVLTPPAALGIVTAVLGKPGTHAAEAILSWKAVKGATGYAVEVCFTPGSLDGPWTALVNGSRRSRVVTAPAPRAQILARVAAVDCHGTLSAWSPPTLVTAR